MSSKHIALISLVVKDYDEAIAFYTQKLGFLLTEDTRLTEEKRWVTVSPPNSECQLLLAKSASDTQKNAVGNQTGGRVFLFLHTSDFWEDYQKLLDQGITFIRPPKEEPYGTVAVFQDLYGNLWDLVQSTH